MWLPVTKDSPSQEDGEVIGFSQIWMDPDFNTNGTRICFRNGELEFTSAQWIDYQDCYTEDNTTTPTHWQRIPKRPFI